MIKITMTFAAILLVTATFSFAQNTVKPETQTQKEVGPVRSSAAYAEVLLRKIELQADLESFTNDYTEQNPKIIDIRFELVILTKDIDRLFAVRPTETTKLTEALGKMVVRRAFLATDLNRMLRTLNADHPEVKRLKRKVEIFATAIKEILG